ncbi:MAG TPA: spore germination protein [Oscillospiraceae bacterium]|nr:spore germination protein [Oscillospiraceae bacterium]
MARKHPGPPDKVSPQLKENLDFLKDKLGIGINIDVLKKDLKLGGQEGALLYIDGLTNGEVAVLVLQKLSTLTREDLAPNPWHKLMTQKIPHMEIESNDSLPQLIDEILAGQMLLLLDGETEGILLDTRTYPARSPEEPDTERLTRGARDGFVETMMFNVALTRRRVRDPGLRVEGFRLGRRSKTDVALMYIQDITNPELVAMVKDRLERVDVDGLPMAEKSVEEFISDSRWSIFPLVRYTERPDVAAQHLFEGHLLLFVDTSPAAMILPVTLFHHLQHPEEYRQNVFTGIYVRWIRFLAVLMSVILAPLYLLFSQQPELLPEFLSFIGPKEAGAIPLFIQFIIVHFGIDLIRIAGIHTPSPLATALSLIAALLIGQIAIDVGLFTPEVLLYGGLVAVGMFATPSFELSQANRLVHLFLLIVTGLFNLPGFLAGIAIVLLKLITNKSFGVPYLWPFFPPNLRGITSTILRQPVPIERTRLTILHPSDQDRMPPKQ